MHNLKLNQESKQNNKKGMIKNEKNSQLKLNDMLCYFIR